MTSATIATATVKFPAKEPKDWGYGMKINVVLTTTQGTEIKIWGKPEDRAIASSLVPHSLSGSVAIKVTGSKYVGSSLPSAPHPPNPP